VFEEDAMPVGRIKNIHPQRGFFFVRVESNRESVDYFAHRSALRGGLRFDRLEENQLVSMEEDPHSEKGPRADTVRPHVG
jgi:cold shock CspA family protein